MFWNAGEGPNAFLVWFSGCGYIRTWCTQEVVMGKEGRCMQSLAIGFEWKHDLYFDRRNIQMDKN